MFRHALRCSEKLAIIVGVASVSFRFVSCFTYTRQGVHFSGVAYVLNGRTFEIFGSVHYIVDILCKVGGIHSAGFHYTNFASWVSVIFDSIM